MRPACSASTPPRPGGNSTSAGTSTSGSGSPSYTQTQATKNNAVDKTTTNLTIVPGALNRQTIAVAAQLGVAGKISTTQLQQMVATAAGINASRGDTVSVTSVAFSNAAAKSAATALQQSQAAQSAGHMTQIITTAIQVVGGLVFFVLLFGLLRKLFKRPENDPRDAGAMNVMPLPVPATPSRGAGQLGGYGAAGVLPRSGNGTAPTVALPAADPQFAQLQADVDALAGSDPEQTAEYLRALMGDRAGV